MVPEKVLILGGTRFIGPAIVESLRARGAGITVFHRGLHHATIPLVVDERIGDRTNGEALRDLISDVRPDAIIDTFAMTEDTAQVTLDALEGWSGRLVMLSSCDVYRNFGGALGVETEPPSSTPLDEDSPVRSKLYPYRAHPPRLASDPQAWRDRYDKIPVEKAYLAAGAVVLRLPMVFGPGDYQHRMAPYLRRMLDDRPFILLAEEFSGYVFPRGYIDNVADAIATATYADVQGRIFNVVDERLYTELEWIQAIAQVMDWRGEVLTVPTDGLPESLRPGLGLAYRLEISGRRIRAELGFNEGVSPDEAIARCVAWERENMPEISCNYDEEDAAADKTK